MRAQSRPGWWFSFLPQLLPLLLVAVKAAAHPAYRVSYLGFDLLFASMTFDIWAFQTLFCRRMIVFGGLLDVPKGSPGKLYIRYDGTRLLVMFLLKVVFLFPFARLGSQDPAHWLTACAILLALAFPAALITGLGLPDACVSEPSA